ncbi:PAS domain S-box protein [Fulvivirgaceae bacterium BMA10]|uniref:PAS domain S-box protein n=1 Tax=Splendidivirga corallicola TaxID=3051826 RepID=A0ABT8KI03_9BACT|nr:PAS domain S-box protein [Fulvivirgaceae bacterium BMA10]
MSVLFSKKKLRDLDVLLRLIPDIVILMDRNGIYLDVIANTGGTLLPPKQLIGKSLFEIGIPKPLVDYFLDKIRMTLATNEIQYAEYEFPKQDGIHWHEARLIKCGKNEVVAIVRDITKIKLAEEKLRDRNKRLTEIARLNSHEIRRPTASILGLISLFDKKNMSTENLEILERLEVCTCELDKVIAKTAKKTHLSELECSKKKNKK